MAILRSIFDFQAIFAMPESFDEKLSKSIVLLETFTQLAESKKLSTTLQKSENSSPESKDFAVELSNTEAYRNLYSNFLELQKIISEFEIVDDLFFNLATISEPNNKMIKDLATELSKIEQLGDPSSKPELMKAFIEKLIDLGEQFQIMDKLLQKVLNFRRQLLKLRDFKKSCQNRKNHSRDYQKPSQK